ncbi:MAG: glycosyltransferase [Campylobacterales bacterium]|nr:glycosyltransferase [Campylobacterales bacterium]
MTDTFCDLNGVSRFLNDMLDEATLQNKQLYVITVTAKHRCKQHPNSFILQPVWKMEMPFYKELDFVVPSYTQIKEKILTLNPDIMHISTPGVAGLYGRLIAKKYNIPLVGTYHTDFPMYVYKNTKLNMLKKITQTYLRWFYKDFRFLLSRSNEYIKIIQQDIYHREVHTIHPGINIQNFHPKYKNMDIWSQYHIQQDRMKFLYVGRVTNEKNLDFLFEAWKIFYTKHEKHSPYLIIVGEGNITKYQKNYPNLNIKFLGRKINQELATIYTSSDIFAFPSTTDTLGQVVFEAIASGLPVLVSNIGGPQTIVNRSSKQVGFINSIQNHQEWADLFEYCLHNPQILQQLTKNCLEYSQTFSISKSFLSFWQSHTKLLQR